MSGGTRASLVGVVAAPSFSVQGRRVRPERGAKDLRRFEIGDREQAGVSVGSSEHFALPRVAEQLREVNCYLGWFGPASRAMQLMSGGMSVAMKLPGCRELWKAAGEKLVKGSSGGPDEEARSKTGSHIVAIAYDGAGHALSEVHLTGVDGYTFTGRMLAWGAERAAAGELQGTGALGPVDGFGLEALTKAAPRPASRRGKRRVPRTPRRRLPPRPAECGSREIRRHAGGSSHSQQQRRPRSSSVS